MEVGAENWPAENVCNLERTENSWFFGLKFSRKKIPCASLSLLNSKVCVHTLRMLLIYSASAQEIPFFSSLEWKKLRGVLRTSPNSA